MKLKYLDRDFGPAACEQLCPPRSASSHCTGDSNFMAIASPLVLGRKCTSVPLDNPGLSVSLSPATKPTRQLFILRLDLDCSFDTLLDNNYCQSSLRRRFGEPGLSPAVLLSFPNCKECPSSATPSVPFTWGCQEPSQRHWPTPSPCWSQGRLSLLITFLLQEFSHSGNPKQECPVFLQHPLAQGELAGWDMAPSQISALF